MKELFKNYFRALKRLFRPTESKFCCVAGQPIDDLADDLSEETKMMGKKRGQRNPGKGMSTTAMLSLNCEPKQVHFPFRHFPFSQPFERKMPERKMNLQPAVTLSFTKLSIAVGTRNKAVYSSADIPLSALFFQSFLSLHLDEAPQATLRLQPLQRGEPGEQIIQLTSFNGGNYEHQKIRFINKRHHGAGADNLAGRAVAGQRRKPGQPSTRRNTRRD